MLKRTKRPDELRYEGVEAFDLSRREQTELFKSGMGVFKRKITQGLYWTVIDKDLADQYIRDERWFFGIKFCDILKVIDHGAEEIKNNDKIGFIKK